MKLYKLFFFFLTGIVTLSACSDDDSNGDNNGGSGTPQEMILTGHYPLTYANEERLPISIDGIDWTYGSDKKINASKIYAAESTIKYSDNKIEIFNIRLENSKEVKDTITLYLEKERIVKTTQKWGNESPVTYFHYNDQGYLVRVSETNRYNQDRDVLKATIENGNVTEVEKMKYSLSGTEPYETITYKYSYDNKAYIPMSDWGPYTLTFQASYPNTMIYDSLLGNKSKNNVTRIDIQYSKEQFSPCFNFITFEPEFDEDNKLISIKHTGRYTGWQSEGSLQTDFSKSATYFKYTEKQ